MVKYLGIDLGGTYIKGGVFFENGEIIFDTKIPTEVDKGADGVMDNIAKLVEILIDNTKSNKSDFLGVGVGVPGMIDDDAGIVVCSGNFGWYNVELVKGLQNRIGLPVKISNDANVAALGETIFGVGNKYSNSVLVTLGTGVGGGIIIDKKIFAGNHSAGAELGHMIICANGEHCNCGNSGCFEAYASASGLIRDTKNAMLKNKDSKMWENGIDNVDGSTAFKYENVDDVAKSVVERYSEMLGIGLANIANIFRPEIIMLGGGVSNEGQNLLNHLQVYFDNHIFARGNGPKVEIAIATLGNKAGFMGAGVLFK